MTITSFLSKYFGAPNIALTQQSGHDLSCFQKILYVSCLRPNYRMRRQLVAGYGITAFATVFIVIFMAIIAAQRAGSKVRDESINLFKTQLDAVLQESGVLTGDILDKKMDSLRGSANLLVEIVRDRIVGYPNDGWEDDIHVPFVDRNTGRRIYPLKGPLLPRDYMMTSNLDPTNSTNLREHVQERGDTYKLGPFLQIWNTESAMFTFQGNCDPDLTDPTNLGYYPFCTEENNDASLGGKINPTTTLAPLEQKAADIGIFTKAIFEAQSLAHSVGVWFVNSGAGAGVQFPSFTATPGLEFTSAGCDWMKEINPLTNRSYGTAEEINRCTPAGTRSSIREYNGLEREWCADQALNPGETRIFGPYAGATWLSWRLTIGRAVFDRKTNELIACTHVDLSKVQAEKLLKDIAEDMRSDIVLTKPDGTVVVGAEQTDADGNIINQIPKLWETGFIDLETYQDLTEDLAFWEDEWDIESAKKTYNKSVKSNGNYFTVFPSPIPPENYDPLYKPDFLIFGSIDAEEQDDNIEQIKDIISNDTNNLIIISVTLGAVGLCCMMVVITLVAEVLTRPLKWMDHKAQEIVNHTEKRESDALIVADEEDNQIHFCSFLPKTEIHELVSEFRSMVSGFSGAGASTVAVPRQNEMKNYVTWKEDFRKFYNLSPNVEQQMNVMTRSVSRRMSKKMVMRAGSNSMRGSIRRNMRKSLSGRTLEGWNNTTSSTNSSFPMTNSDFEQILAAADEADDEDDPVPVTRNVVDASSPIFRSTQMTGEPTNESRPQPVASATPFIASATLSAAAGGAAPLKPWDSEQSEFERFPRPPTRINIGPNILRDIDRRRLGLTTDKNRMRIIRSPLYWNVLCWIVVPLLAAIIAMMSIVGMRILDTFPEWINAANTTSLDLEVDHLKSSTTLIKKHFEQLFVEPLHDLHTITRMSGWLLFGGVDRSDGFTDIDMTMVDECKYYDKLSECPYEKSDTRSPCPCEWNDPWGRTCKKEDEEPPLTSNARYIQKLWYLNQNRETDKVFPEVNYSPNSTSWYTDPDQMQGPDDGNVTEGYSTAYDRVQVASALSAIIFPVYNYGIDARGDGSTTSAISGYISFEGEGEYGGFSGCSYDAAGYAKFFSSDANNAYKISDLCPKGKYGYDPRCRGWFDNSKQQALRDDGIVYITPPYNYATTDEVGVTAVSALMDPKSGEFVGNTLIDFKTEEISKVVDETKIQFYAMILPNATDGQNVVASSEFDDQSTPTSLHDFLCSNGTHHGSPKYQQVEEIIKDMENEGTGANCNLYRTDEKDGIARRFCYVYEPIFHRELRPVNPDDFSSGAMDYTKFLYSIITLQEFNEVSSEFLKRKDDIDQVLRQTYIIYMITTILTTLICIIVTAMISLYVTKPMIQLLQIVKQVNAGGIEDDMPPLTGGSREIHQVYASFAKLYKTVHMSNWAFFAGDLSLAYRISRDALRLFRKIGDQKAIAIACNNIGNTLLAWMVECREPGTSLELEGDDSNYCTEAAIMHYTEAIELGTKDFEEASGDAEKARFAQQLADRHFNRAMCLLLTADDPCASNDSKETALDDLYLVKQYDQGVKEYMLHSKTLLENSDVIFERSIRRLHGLAALIDIEPDVWDVWDIYELVDQADLMLQAAWNQEEAPIFAKMTKIGRLQELEGAVTGIELASGKANDAVQLATRMFIEDEFLLDSSFIEAADCILQCSQKNRDDRDDEDDGDVDDDMGTAFQDGCIMELKQEFKMMRKHWMRNALDIGRAFIFCIDLKGEWNGQPLLSNLRGAILTFYEENFQLNDTVGIVTFAPKDGTLKKVQPSSAKDLLSSDQYPHRDSLVAATTGVACSRFSPALQGGIDMALQVESSSASDVCLLYISDGGAYDEAIYSRLRRRLEASSRNTKTRSVSSASMIDLVVIDLGASQGDFTSRSSQSTSMKTAMMQMAQQRSLKDIVQQHSSRHLRVSEEVSFEDSCKSLVTATRSRASVYLEANLDNLDEAFRRATASINQGTSFAGNRLQRALTMQKF